MTTTGSIWSTPWYQSARAWFPSHHRQQVESMGADEISQLKNSSAKCYIGWYIFAVAMLVQTLLGLIAMIIYVLYPRSNGINVLTVATVDFKCPQGSWITDKTVGVYGKCYLFRTTTEIYDTAKADCAALAANSHLVTIKSAEEQAAIAEHHAVLGISKDTCSVYWTSGHRPVTPAREMNKFVWHDGSDVASKYTYWKAGKPSDLDKDCLSIDVKTSLLWQDEKCGTGKHCYICELS